MFSGQQLENPLLLLGQYSDDELEEDSNERPNNGTMENSSPGKDDMVIKGFDCVCSIPIKPRSLYIYYALKEVFYWDVNFLTNIYEDM